MKKTFISLFSLLTVMGAVGQSRLNLTLKNGNSHWFQMQDTKITFEGSQVVITEKERNRAPFSLYDVAKLSIAEPPASAEKVQHPASLSVYIDNNELRFKGVTSDDVQGITIYNLNGQRVYAAKQSLNNPVPLSNLSKGIYLIRTQSQTIKFIK